MPPRTSPPSLARRELVVHAPTTVLKSRLLTPLSAALFALVQSSCLVTSVDDFPEPPSTPPFLQGSQASPPLNQIILADQNTNTVTFSAYVRSEDAGVDLDARLVVNWPATNTTLQITQIGASSFADERLISFTWNPRAPTLSGDFLAPGCYPVTLIVSHRFNTLTNIPARLSDSDFLVWWVFLGDSADLTRFDVSTCPNPRRLPSVQGTQ